jgi:hypothetical protein
MSARPGSATPGPWDYGPDDDAPQPGRFRVFHRGTRQIVACRLSKADAKLVCLAVNKRLAQGAPREVSAARTWDAVEPSLEGYSQLIQLLMHTMPDNQLEKFADRYAPGDGDNGGGDE